MQLSFSMALLYSRDELQQQLANIIQEGGVFIYWNHTCNEFNWLKHEDQSVFKCELTNLCRQLREGTAAITVTSGEPIAVNDVTCYGPCFPYVLLGGNPEHTPYFFTN